jgi:hypothetical protein
MRDRLGATSNDRERVLIPCVGMRTTVTYCLSNHQSWLRTKILLVQPVSRKCRAYCTMQRVWRGLPDILPMGTASDIHENRNSDNVPLLLVKEA